MAIIIGNPEKTIKKQFFRMLLLPLIVAITFTVVTALSGSTNLTSKNIVTTLLLLSLYLLFLVQSNKKYLLKFFNKNKYSLWSKENKSITDILTTLPEDTVVFRHITLELIHVDAVIISPKNIFVLRHLSDLDNTFGTEHEKSVDLLWKSCHIINVTLKKYFDTDSLPTPIISHNDLSITTSTHREALVSHTSKIHQAINKHAPTPNWNMTVRHQFSHFIHNRYVKN